MTALVNLGMPGTDLRDVLAGGMCSSCGACVLAGAASGMALDSTGALRPVPATAPGAAPPLKSYCPALTVERPDEGGQRVDPFFGPYLAVWSGYARDPEVRHQGSSGGVLTALAAAALALGESAAVAVARGEESGTATTAVMAERVEDLRGTASSRYAPVSTVAGFAESGLGLASGNAIVGRPCEASAVRRLAAATEQEAPLLLSFFCAGVPSQAATDELVAGFGVEPGRARGLRYRGAGWPGLFRFRDPDGAVYSMTYEQSWGEHLGRRVMPRCKVCVDGVGESADVVAGDIWESDERGFPLFSESPGMSVVIARTRRGLELVNRAVQAGYLAVEPVDVAVLRPVQPLQVSRRRYLAARLAGRRLAGQKVPRYRGFGLIRLALSEPRESLRQARGSYRRARAERAAASGRSKGKG